MGNVREVNWLQIEQIVGSRQLARIEFRPDQKLAVGLSNPRFILSNVEVRVGKESEVCLISKADPVEVRFTAADEVGELVDVNPGQTLLFDAKARVIGFRLNEPFRPDLNLGST